MTAALAITVAVMATAMVVMAIRLAGAQTAEAKALMNRNRAEIMATNVSQEFRDHRTATKARFLALLEDIERLEDDLENCSTPGARRSRLRSLLSKAQTDTA